MRLALAAVALVVASTPGWAAENYVCNNHGKTYSVSFDRDAKSLTINGEKADIEHLSLASQVVEVRGTVDLGNVFFWAELNNMSMIEWMKEQRVTRVDQCHYVEKAPT